MKRLFLLLLVCVCVGFEGRAQYVTIPDYEFRVFLQSKYPACFNGLGQMDTTCSAIVNEDSLTLFQDRYNTIYNTSGLRYFKNLNYLFRPYNSYFPITEFPSGLKELKIIGDYVPQLPTFPATLIKFSISSNDLSSVSLPAFPAGLRYLNVNGEIMQRIGMLPDSLQVLIISNSSLASLPLLPVGLRSLYLRSCDRLSGLPVLPDQLNTLSVVSCMLINSLPNIPLSFKNLYIANSSVGTIPAFPSSLTMDSIDVSNCRYLSSIASLPGSLKFLDCHSSSLRNLPVLPNDLRYLNCSSCNSLTAIPNIPAALKKLFCFGSMRIDSIPPFPASMSMDTVDIYGCDIRNLYNLPDTLIYLNCSYNRIKTLPRLPVSLRYLYSNMGNYYYTDLDFTAMPLLPEGLEILECRAMGVNSIGPFPASLTRIDCSSNRLRVLPALPSGLTYLKCSENRLTELPQLPITLYDLNCSSNRLGSLPIIPDPLRLLDFSSNLIRHFPELSSKVVSINCSSNPLYSLPSLPDSLQALDCSYDSLSALPPMPKMLSWLHCNNNLLTELPALASTKLNIFDCSKNKIHCVPVLPKDMGYRFADNYTQMGLVKVDSTVTCMANIPINTRFDRYVWNGYMYTTDYNPPPLCNPTNNRNHCASFPVMQGIVFYDNNGDGVYSAGEQVKKNVKVSLSNGNFTFTNNNGFYEIAADSLIAFTLSVPAPARFNTVPASYRYTFTNFDTLVVNNFALQPNAVVDSVTFSTTALRWAARPGFAFPVMVNYDNVGTTTLTPNITFNYDNTKLTYDSSSNAGVSNNGNSLSLNVGSFVPGQQGRFIAYFRVKPTVALGDSIKSTAVLTSNALVANSSMSNVVSGSFDPNDKNATPQLSPSQVAAGQYIDYTIRFQNTGNDTAFNIIITDTLSSDLKASTFQMKGASHTCKTTVKGNVVYFEFLNILLADSTVNEPLSHGFVTFSIQPKATVAVNTTINNKAAIYFDYNAPIITNTAGTLIKDFAVLPLHLVSFTAVPQFNNSTALNWVTSNEVNSKYFVIEQSSDARKFAAIATVLAKGNASNQYNSLATDLNNSLVYYRLKMVDRDGTFSYSPVLKIDRRKNTAGFSVLSNPVKDALIIYTNDPQLNGSSCSIINTQGAVVKQFVLQQGNQSVDLKALPSGMYYLKTNHGSSRILLQ